MRTLSRALMRAGVILFALSRPSSAQQYVTDDALLTDYRACQIQIWHGQRSSWALPVCTPIRNLEVSAGLIAVWEDDADGHPEYVAQLKTILIPNRGRNWSVGFVLGTGRDPGLSGVRAAGANVYAYVPVTAQLLDQRLAVHTDIGYLYDHRAGQGNDKDYMTVAGRADLSIRKYFLVIAEAYDSPANDAEFQTGIRWWGRPGRVQFDLSYGGYLKKWGHAAGWTIGLALTAPSVL